MSYPPTIFDKDARRWAMLCHLVALSGLFLPWIAHLAGPLIVWLLKRNDHPFIDRQGKESLNFQLSLTLYSAVGCVFLLITIVGVFLIPLLLMTILLLNVIGVVVASIRSSDGVDFRYPLIFRFLK